MKEEELRERCRRRVRQVLAQRGWALVQDEATFVEEVVAEVQSRIPNSRRSLEKVIEDATVNRYCYVWYRACKADGMLRQRHGFEELHRYLYSVALYRAKHDQRIAEESTQEALIKVWQHLDQIRDPGSFARWASQIVLREVLATQKPREISGIDLTHLSDSEEGVPLITRVAHQVGYTTPSPERELVSDIRTALVAAVQQCLNSAQQETVIIGLFFDQKSFKELADELRTRVENVYVLKSRALDRLRECYEFLEMLEELL